MAINKTFSGTSIPAKSADVATPKPSVPKTTAARPALGEDGPPAPRPSLSARAQVQVGEASGFDSSPRTSLFPAFKADAAPTPMARDANAGDGLSQGRTTHGGNSDDSLGRTRGGNSDDSIGRTRGGTGDDSIGRTRGGTSDDSIGRTRGGTSDDSIGRTRGGTSDDSIGTQTADGRTRDLRHDDMDHSAALRSKVNLSGMSRASQKVMDSLQDPKQVGAGKAEAASYVLHSEAFNQLPSGDREAVVDIMSRGDVRSCRLLGLMAERSSFGNATASDGTSMLKNLDNLAKSPTGNAVLNTALADIANPDRIWQGNSPTCTVTSMQYELAHENPGEYARVISGLARDGHVTMAGGGELTKPPGTSLDYLSLQEQARTPTEALFQDSAMEYANGKDTYDAANQRSVKSDGTSYQGLKGPMIRDMAAQLFGQDYERTNITSDRQASELATELNGDATPNRPVLIDIDYGSFNHCVAFESNRNGVVTYRDPETGRREQMPIAEFNHRAVAIYNAPPPPPPEQYDVGGG